MNSYINKTLTSVLQGNLMQSMSFFIQLSCVKNSLLILADEISCDMAQFTDYETPILYHIPF